MRMRHLTHPEKKQTFLYNSTLYGSGCAAFFMVRGGRHNWLIIKSKKSNSEKAMGLGCKRHDFGA